MNAASHGDERLPGVRRIVVLRANALGDFIFALPALDALRLAYPHAEIVLLGRAWHAAFLAERPGPIDRVVPVPGDASPEAEVGGRFADAPWLAASPVERAAFAERMHEEGIDLAIQIHGGGRNSNPFVTTLGATATIGLRAEDAPPLDRWVRFVYYQQEVLRCLEVVALAGARPAVLEPQLTIIDRDRLEARRALVAMSRPFAVLHPGANDPRRRWPVERFASVGAALSRAGLNLVVTGSRSESDLTGQLTAALAAVSPASRTHVRDLAGRTSLSGLAGVLAGAQLVVSNDSGPLHLAAAVGTPTVGIYWCGNLINGGPLTRARHRPVISWRVRCPVCGIPSTEPRCEHDDSFVADVRVDEVLHAARDLLGSTNDLRTASVGAGYATAGG